MIQHGVEFQTHVNKLENGSGTFFLRKQGVLYTQSDVVVNCRINNSDYVIAVISDSHEKQIIFCMTIGSYMKLKYINRKYIHLM